MKKNFLAFTILLMVGWSVAPVTAQENPERDNPLPPENSVVDQEKPSAQDAQQEPEQKADTAPQVDQEDVAQIGGTFFPGQNGLFVHAVHTNGPLYEDFRTGDFITKIDGTDVRQPMDIERIIANKKPGDSITVLRIRAGSEEEVQVSLISSKELAKVSSENPTVLVSPSIRAGTGASEEQILKRIEALETELKQLRDQLEKARAEKPDQSKADESMKDESTKDESTNDESPEDGIEPDTDSDGS